MEENPESNPDPTPDPKAIIEPAMDATPPPQSEHGAKRSDILAGTLCLLGIGMTLLLGPEWGWPFLFAGLASAVVYFAMWRVQNPTWLSKALLGILAVFVLSALLVIAWKLRPIPAAAVKTVPPFVPKAEDLAREYANALRDHERLHPSPSRVPTGTTDSAPGGIANSGKITGGATVTNCPNGICIYGGTVMTPTINNTLPWPKPIEDIVPFLNCDLFTRQVSFSANSDIYVMALYPIITGGVQRYFKLGNAADGVWPDPTEPLDNIYRCQLTNYGEDPFFAIALSFRVVYIEVVKDASYPGSKQAGEITSSGYWPIEIPLLETKPPSNTFTFYIQNFTNKFVTVYAPENATLEPKHGAQRVQVRLKASSLIRGVPMTLLPWSKLAK